MAARKRDKERAREYDKTWYAANRDREILLKSLAYYIRHRQTPKPYGATCIKIRLLYGIEPERAIAIIRSAWE